MNIECINCSKIFEVNSDLIPKKGRNLQCGSCNHIWFFSKENQLKIKKKDIEIEKNFPSILDSNDISDFNDKKEKKSLVKTKKIDKEISNHIKRKTNFRISHFLSFIIVLIISFVAIIIIIDTFKIPLFNLFPKLEHIFYNLIETIKDISLFIKDLI